MIGKRWSELFLVDEPNAVVDVCNECHRKEQAGLPAFRHPHKDTPSARTASGNELSNLSYCIWFCGDRAYCARQTVTDFDAASKLHQLFADLIVILSWTYRRLIAAQVWPLLMSTPKRDLRLSGPVLRQAARSPHRFRPTPA